MSILVICDKTSKLVTVSFKKLNKGIKKMLKTHGKTRRKNIRVDYRQEDDPNLTHDHYSVIVVMVAKDYEINRLDLYKYTSPLKKKGNLLFTHHTRKKCNINSVKFIEPLFSSDVNKLIRNQEGLFKSSNDPFSLTITNNTGLLPELINWMCKDLQNRIDEVIPYLPKHVVDDMITVSNFCLSQGVKYDTEKARTILAAVSPYTIVEGLGWRGNSCYMDSALQCLLAVPSQLNEYILNVNLEENVIMDIHICGDTEARDLEVRKEIQEELGMLTDTIRGNGRPRETADEFREILRKCKLKQGQRFFDDCTQDSGDFLAWLLSRFPVEKGVVRVETFYTNSEEDTADNLHLSTTVERSQGPVIDVGRSLLVKIYDNKPVPISSFVTWSDDSGTMLNDDGLGSIKASEGDIAGQRFSRRITQNKIMMAPGAMIFSIMRGGADDFGTVQDVLRHPVFPTYEIELESGQNFRFSGVTVHQSNHYWCYYRHRNAWYLYNDTSQQTPKKIGSYKTLIKNHSIIMTHGTVFYYNQVSGVRGLS